jgi:hypothetical protein
MTFKGLQLTVFAIVAAMLIFASGYEFGARRALAHDLVDWTATVDVVDLTQPTSPGGRLRFDPSNGTVQQIDPNTGIALIACSHGARAIFDADGHVYCTLAP